MLRNEWEFGYKAGTILKGAEVKHKYHTARLKWWEDKLEEVKKKIKAEGIEIDESLSNLTSNAYRGASVNIRNDLVQDVQECVSKTQEHRARVVEYAAWIQVLESQGNATFQLNQDDWLFFFSRG